VVGGDKGEASGRPSILLLRISSGNESFFPSIPTFSGVLGKRGEKKRKKYGPSFIPDFFFQHDKRKKEKKEKGRRLVCISVWAGEVQGGGEKSSGTVRRCASSYGHSLFLREELGGGEGGGKAKKEEKGGGGGGGGKSRRRSKRKEGGKGEPLCAFVSKLLFSSVPTNEKRGRERVLGRGGEKGGACIARVCRSGRSGGCYGGIG